MKRSGNLYPGIYEEDNLKLAFLRASKGKNSRSYVDAFRKDLQSNIKQLQEQLINDDCDIGNYRYFYVRDPKVRRICEASFHERILHHAIMNVCGEYIERGMISDSYACRKGKGTHQAVNRALANSRHNKWYLKLDIKKYFDSIDHKILLSMYYRLFKDQRLLELFSKITFSHHTEPDVGLPLGGLFSQYSANFYLNRLDHYVKEELRVACYVRYMDDFVLWGNSSALLKTYLAKIESFLEQELRLSLKNDIQLNLSSHGLPFLGFRIYPQGLKLKKESFKRFRKKISAIEKKYAEDKITETELASRVNSLISHIIPGTNNNVRNSIIQKYTVY